LLLATQQPWVRFEPARPRVEYSRPRSHIVSVMCSNDRWSGSNEPVESRRTVTQSWRPVNSVLTCAVWDRHAKTWAECASTSPTPTPQQPAVSPIGALLAVRQTTHGLAPLSTRVDMCVRKSKSTLRHPLLPYGYSYKAF